MGSLVKGIGSKKKIEEYYDNWADNYDETLKNWKYKAPYQCTKIIKKKIKLKPKYLLDLACGTGLFVQSFYKFYPNCICDGSDVSQKILKEAKKKNIYRKLFKTSFERKITTNQKYDIVSLIGAMTYCQNHLLLFDLVSDYLSKKGYFIFTQRVDIWEKLNFNKILKDNSQFNVVYKSKPLNYLPQNKDFESVIKIRIVLLNKALT